MSEQSALEYAIGPEWAPCRTFLLARPGGAILIGGRHPNTATILNRGIRRYSLLAGGTYAIARCFSVQLQQRFFIF